MSYLLKSIGEKGREKGCHLTLQKWGFMNTCLGFNKSGLDGEEGILVPKASSLYVCNVHTQKVGCFVILLT